MQICRRKSVGIKNIIVLWWHSWQRF